MFLLHNYTKFNCLATNSWFKTLSEYLNYCEVKLHLRGDLIPHLFKRDCVLMEEEIHLLLSLKWLLFNCAYKYFKVYFINQLLLSNDSTIYHSKLNCISPQSSSMNFPKEQPTPADSTIWTHILILLTSLKVCLSLLLRKYLHQLYDSTFWVTHLTRDYICIFTLYYPHPETYNMHDLCSMNLLPPLMRSHHTPTSSQLLYDLPQPDKPTPKLLS